MTSSDAAPGPAAAAPVPPETAAARPARPDRALTKEGAPEAGAPVIARPGVPAAGSVLPEQAPEDTDAGWGEYPEPANDRLYRDRPPHWDDF
jgi:hypothetical protein